MEKYFSEQETAEYLGVSLGKLRRDRQSKIGLPFIKYGKRVMYRLSEIEGYMDSNTIVGRDKY